jgi:hypothetical protein
MGSWGHTIHRLDEATIDRYDRFGERCATGRCTSLPTHATQWSYITGRGGRVSNTLRSVCTVHGHKFAAKHALHIGDPQPPRTSTIADPQPPRTSTIADPQPPRTSTIADIVTGLTDYGHTTTIKVVKNCRWYLEHHSTGSSWAGFHSTWLAGQLPTATLAEAIAEAERELARHQLVPAGEWTNGGAWATAPVTSAWLTEPWRSQQWTLTVAQQPPTEYDLLAGRPGMWTLTRTLDPRFGVTTTDLGWHNMSLLRAVGVATDLLHEQGWYTVDGDDWSSTHPDDTVSHHHGWHPDQLRNFAAARAADQKR